MIYGNWWKNITGRQRGCQPDPPTIPSPSITPTNTTQTGGGSRAGYSLTLPKGTVLEMVAIARAHWRAELDAMQAEYGKR
ncbi:MAG: hypothetical protein ACE5GO_12125, partial [Anaerolineales bacterium]